MNPSSEKFQASAAVANMIALYKDARLFVRQVLGGAPDAWQLEALEAVSIGRRDCLALVACKGPGKSTCLAGSTLR